MEFCFYPLKSNGKITYTVLKRSKYFINKFGALVDDHDRFKVHYTPKYIVISILESNKWENYVFVVELFSKEGLVKTAINYAIRTSGPNAIFYYCFANRKPEIFVALGKSQENFKAFEEPAKLKFFNFYKGPVTNLVLRIYKEKDEDNEPLIGKSRRILAQYIIDGVYGGIKSFCSLHNFKEKSIVKYLSGETSEIEYNNGNKIPGRRLEDILNISVQLTAKGLKNSNLLTKIKFDDIPEYSYEAE